MTTICGLALLALWSVNGFAPPFTHQEAPQTDVSVELGVEIAARGDQLRLPVILNTHDKEVRSATLRVTFPAGNLTFEQAQAPSGGNTDPVDIAAEVAAGAEGEKKTLELRVSSKAGSSLRDGIVALLVFTVAKAASPGDVAIGNSPRVAIGDSEQQLVAQGKDGLVTILETQPLVVSCMFYMH